MHTIDNNISRRPISQTTIFITIFIILICFGITIIICENPYEYDETTLLVITKLFITVFFTLILLSSLNLYFQSLFGKNERRLKEIKVNIQNCFLQYNSLLDKITSSKTLHIPNSQKLQYDFSENNFEDLKKEVKNLSRQLNKQKEQEKEYSQLLDETSTIEQLLNKHERELKSLLEIELIGSFKIVFNLLIIFSIISVIDIDDNLNPITNLIAFSFWFFFLRLDNNPYEWKLHNLVVFFIPFLFLLIIMIVGFTGEQTKEFFFIVKNINIIITIMLFVLGFFTRKTTENNWDKELANNLFSLFMGIMVLILLDFIFLLFQVKPFFVETFIVAQDKSSLLSLFIIPIVIGSTFFIVIFLTSLFSKNEVSLSNKRVGWFEKRIPENRHIGGNLLIWITNSVFAGIDFILKVLNQFQSNFIHRCKLVIQDINKKLIFMLSSFTAFYFAYIFINKMSIFFYKYLSQNTNNDLGSGSLWGFIALVLTMSLFNSGLIKLSNFKDFQSRFEEIGRRNVETLIAGLFVFFIVGVVLWFTSPFSLFSSFKQFGMYKISFVIAVIIIIANVMIFFDTKEEVDKNKT